jgi:hypothetical protein
MALAAWAVEIGLITLRDLGISPPGITWKSKGNVIPLNSSGSGLPAPGDYLATFVLFAPLAALADTQAKPVAEALAWAYVLATLLNIVNPSNPVSGKPTGTSPTTGQTNGPTVSPGA